MKLRKMSDNLATQALELREDIQAKEKELAKKRKAKEAGLEMRLRNRTRYYMTFFESRNARRASPP